MILTGVAVNALAGAVIGLDDLPVDRRRAAQHHVLDAGQRVAQATWEKVRVVGPLAIIGVVIACTRAHQLDLLSLGERPARHLGVDVERLRVLMLAVIALLTASAVAVSGIILFVGLVMPHLVRMVDRARAPLAAARVRARRRARAGRRRHDRPHRDRAVGDPARRAHRARRRAVLPLDAAPHPGAPGRVGMSRVLRRRARSPARVERGDALVRARGVTVERGGRAVVREVDLEVRAGEVVALVGPNGSGKSTLLAAMSGDLPLAGGTVELDGAPIDSWTPHELAMRRAVLPQQAVVTFPFTVRQVVQMGRAPWAGTDRADDDDARDRARARDHRRRGLRGPVVHVALRR